MVLLFGCVLEAPKENREYHVCAATSAYEGTAVTEFSSPRCATPPPLLSWFSLAFSTFIILFCTSHPRREARSVHLPGWDQMNTSRLAKLDCSPPPL
mmetsp:Transcript_29833/g.81544  ORF Transcript_29833/g.81544 Transcript_29833/m.81544 type:complete len:97 (-) Transcript_29833:118-408(-)